MAPWRTAQGACLLLWLASLGMAQVLAPPATLDSPMDNPFSDQGPAFYQQPVMQVPPGQAPCPLPMGQPNVTEPAPPQCPEPTTLGDLLFALVNLSRFLAVNPEEALRKTIARFIARFRYIEEELARRGRSLRQATLEEMDALWNEAKKLA